MPDCCYVEQPCHEHLTKAFGDIVKDFDPVKITIQTSQLPSWINSVFLGWRHGAVHEDDFIKSFHYMAKSGTLRYEGKLVVYPEPKEEKQVDTIEEI